jgi:hypothetical protein
MSAPIKLEAHICDQRRSYLVTFATEAQALDFIARRSSTHAIFELEDAPIDQAHVKLNDVLHPTCEHGLSASLCYGPSHYASDEEIARGY